MIRALSIKTEDGNETENNSFMKRVAHLDLILEDPTGKLEARRVTGYGTNNAVAINDAFRIVTLLVYREIAP
jgi:hypothetical protein